MTKVKLWATRPIGDPTQGECPFERVEIETLAEGFDLIATAGEGFLNIDVEEIPGNPLTCSFSIELKWEGLWQAERLG